jgi:transcription elongation GreA/GreB family factor
MNKNELLDLIIKKLEEDFDLALLAMRATYEAATHEESKPENEYDTRGLEASYLAGAQSKRVAEIEELIYTYKNTPLKKFIPTDVIATSALVKLECNGKKTFIFLMPKGSGLMMPFENQMIQLIAPSSPLGEALLGLRVGDVAVVEKGTTIKEYEVLSLE